MLPQNENGETIRELANRHLHDNSHHTTDEELKNAQVEFTPVEQSELSDTVEEDNGEDKA